jgi:hypothetical protein
MDAENATGQRNLKRLYEITRTFSGKNNNPSRPRPVQDKYRNTTPVEEDQRSRWAEHFKETLNRPNPPVQLDIPPPTLLARQTSPRPSSPSSQARQQALMEYHLKH